MTLSSSYAWVTCDFCNDGCTDELLMYGNEAQMEYGWEQVHDLDGQRKFKCSNCVERDDNATS